MTPRTIDWRSVRAKLRRIRGPLRVAGAVPLAVEQYGEYVRQVAAFVRHHV